MDSFLNTFEIILAIVGGGGLLAAVRWRKYISTGLFLLKQIKRLNTVAHRDEAALIIAAQLGFTAGEELSQHFTKKYGRRYQRKEVLAARFMRECAKGLIKDNK